jgi:ankyrin repeat protein
MSKKNIFDRFSFGHVDRLDSHGLTKLYRAARHGDLSTVKYLLKKGADPNVSTRCGLRPLHIAAYWGEVKVVKALLEAGADPTLDNGAGWTALHSASLNAGLKGRKEVIDLLIDHGADSTARDEYGWTPKDYADLWKDVNIRKLQDVMNQIRDDRTEYTGHQPNMKKLKLDKKHPPAGNEPPANENDKPFVPKPSNGQVPPHHNKRF